ncbi:histidine kinase [Sphingomonadaceae bacterium]|nr:histidine kinase [Sphingomonadaceae bacterium]
MAASDPDRAQARLPFNVVLASILGLWLCYFLITTARGSLVGLDMQQEMFLRRALVSLAGIGITLGFWLVLRLTADKALWIKIVTALVAALPASILVAQVNQLAFADIEAKVIEQIGEKQGVRLRRDEAGNVLLEVPGLSGEYDDDDAGDGGAEARDDGLPRTLTLAEGRGGLERWRQLTDIALGRYFLLLAWASLYLALLAGAQARAAERREQQFRSAAKAAELRSLRYQVNPHFLFNTLNSLSSLVMTGKTERAEEMIQSISRFYRHSLTDDPTNDVSLEQEFDLQQHYLAIEAARFPKRLQTLFDLPPALAEARIPGMILQPLVENSVKYAVASTSRPVTICLSAREEFGRLVVSVRDNGPGIPEGTKHGFGIGLANVRDRLQARFGRDAQVHSAALADSGGKHLDEEGYVTELRIPLVKHGF